MRTPYLFYFLLIPFSTLIGQVGSGSAGGISTGSNASVLSDLQLLDIHSSDKRTITYEEVEGSPYIDNNTGANNNLPIGKFYTTDFTFITTAFARYNAYTDAMEVSTLEDGVDYFLLKKQPDFLYIVLRKKTYRAYEHNGTTGYFVILSENDTGKCTLLKKEQVLFKKAERPKSSFVTGTPNSFKRLKDVLYFKMDDSILEIPRKKKAFYALFGEQAGAIKTYVEGNQLKINKEEDLLLIGNYYSKLVD